MHTTRQPLGACPRCDATVPESSLLIEYDATDGRGVYAECPDCEDVVTPR